MKRVPAVHICSYGFDRSMVRGLTYEKLRAAVLERGQYSIFEATDGPKLSSLFRTLEHDPTLETRWEDRPYPWIAVRERPR